MACVSLLRRLTPLPHCSIPRRVTTPGSNNRPYWMGVYGPSPHRAWRTLRRRASGIAPRQRRWLERWVRRLADRCVRHSLRSHSVAPGTASASASPRRRRRRHSRLFPALCPPPHPPVLSSNMDIFDARLLCSCLVPLDCPLRGARLLSPRACAASPAGDQYLPRIVSVLVGD